jgi:hypothetical protein
MKFTDIKGLLFIVLAAMSLASCSEPVKENEQLSILEYEKKYR